MKRWRPRSARILSDNGRPKQPPFLLRSSTVTSFMTSRNRSPKLSVQAGCPEMRAPWRSFTLVRGEVEEGADWVERAIHEGDLAMRTVYIRFVACKQLRASHRWPRIAKMINLPAPSSP
jgi:hypothetical protein